MITAEIKINGNLISYLYIVNKEFLPGSLTDCLYVYEYYEVGKDLKRGSVIHKRKDGALKLIEIVSKAAGKEKK